MATETVYVIRDAAGEYYSDAKGWTPASDEADEYATRSEAETALAACGRSTGRILTREID